MTFIEALTQTAAVIAAYVLVRLAWLEVCDFLRDWQRWKH